MRTPAPSRARDAAWLKAAKVIAEASCVASSVTPVDVEEIIFGRRVPTTLAPLLEYTKLRRVTFTSRRVPTFATIAGHRSLSELWLNDGPVLDDVKSLALLPKLASLWIGGKTSLRALARVQLPALRELVVDAKQIAPSLAPLRGMKKLRELIATAKRPVQLELDVLATLPDFAVLALENCDVRDLSPLAGLRMLERCDVDGAKRLTSIAALAKKPRLDSISVARTRVRDLSPLASSRALTFVELQKSAVDDLSPLPSSITYLDASETRVSNVDAVGRMRAIEQIDLSNTGVTDLSPLASLSQLAHLRLENVRATSFDFLAGLPSLREIDLLGTDAPETVCDLLAALPWLTRVRLANTQVTPASRGARKLAQKLAARLSGGLLSFDTKPGKAWREGR